MFNLSLHRIVCEYSDLNSKEDVAIQSGNHAGKLFAPSVDLLSRRRGYSSFGGESPPTERYHSIKEESNIRRGPRVTGYTVWCEVSEQVTSYSHLPRSSSSKEKLRRAVEKIKAITAGAQRIREQHLDPKFVDDEFMWEAVCKKHVFPDCLHKAKQEWLASKDDLSFEEWMLIHPEFSVTEAEEVKYLNSEERKAYEVTIQNGLLMQNGMPYCTKENSTLWSGEGAAIFVEGPDKKIYIGPHIKGRFHHSSFFSGGAIISAGELETDATGKIIKLTNKSGHYKPNLEQTLAILSCMRERGVDLSGVVFVESQPSGGVRVHESALTYLLELTGY